MNYMKYILLGLLFPFAMFGQEGFRLIDKAEERYKAGDYVRALLLLDRAAAEDYGFCGNARIDADNSIAKLRAKIYMDQKQYDLVRKVADSLWFNDMDSLKIVTYQLEIGKDSLSNMIDSSLVHAFIDFHCAENCWAYIPLTNGKDTLCFKVSRQIAIRMSYRSMTAEEMLNLWKAEFTGSKKYGWLKQT